MTVVRPNSISGINSITVASGEALSIHAASGDLVSTLTSASGIATYRGIHVGSGTTTADQGVIVGTGASIVSDAVNTLDVYTNNSNRLRINSSGHVLIGEYTDNAFFKAHAVDGAADDLYVGQFINAEATAGRNYGVNIQAGSNSTDHGLRVKNHAGTVQLIVKGDGNLGLGTLSPVASAANYDGASLHIHQTNSSSAGSQIHLTNGATGSAAGNGVHISMWSDDDLYITNQESDGKIKFASGGNSDVLTINDDATVEVKKATGDAQLIVHAEQNDSGADSELILETSNDFTTCHLMFKDSTGEAGSVAYNHGDNYLKLSTAGTNGGTERLRIGPTGEIGIGGATYGTAGQFLRSGGSGAAVSWADAGGGIDDACQWRLTSSLQGNQIPLTGWELVDTYAGGGFGSAMSESSGIFTFPSTGWWKVHFHLAAYSDSSSQNVIGNIQVTTDNSNYNTTASCQQGIYDYNNSYPSHASASAQALIDVTNTTNDKVRFYYGAGQGSEYAKGHSSHSYTSVVFTRLGDT